MKRFLVAACLVALAAGPAFSQAPCGPNGCKVPPQFPTASRAVSRTVQTTREVAGKVGRPILRVVAAPVKAVGRVLGRGGCN